MKLPLLKTIQHGSILAAGIARRHPWTMVGLLVLFMIFQLGAAMLLRRPMPGNATIPAIAAIIVTVLVLLATAILVHREILVGPTSLRSTTTSSEIRRVVFYAAEIVVIVLLGVLSALPLLLLLPLLPIEFPAMVAALNIAAGLIAGRVSLKLPARAIGEPMTWRQAWTLGRGNTLQLFLVWPLAAYSLSELTGFAAYLAAQVSGILAIVISAVLSLGNLVLTTAWLSTAYLYLTAGESSRFDEVTQEPG